MNPWEILKIKPTVDVKTIKRAYATQLKIYHPEYNPEEFMSIRAAYEKALEEAKYLQNVETEEKCIEEIEFNKDNNISDNTNLNYKVDENINNIIIEGNILEDFIVKVTKLYENFFSRINPKNWDKLLSNEAYEEIENNEVISLNLLNFLGDNNNLPQSVWKVIDKRFLWSERRDLCEIFTEDYINYIRCQINRSSELRYDFFVDDGKTNYDEFISFRSEVYRLLIDNELEAIEKNIQEANKIFDKDPDLIRLEGQYYIRKGQLDSAIEAFSRLIEANPLEIDGYINRAMLLERKGNYKGAYYDYQKTLEIDKLEVRALSGLAECYINSKNYNEAKLILEEAVLENPANISLRISLGEVNSNLIKEIYEDFNKDPNKDNGYKLAKLYFDIEEYNKSEEILTDLIEKNIITSEVYKLLGLIYVEYGEDEESIKYFNKAVTLEYEEDKNAYETLKLRGISYIEIEEYDSAIADFVHLQKTNPNDDEVIYRLAQCYCDKDDDDCEKALKLINKAIEINPDNWEYYSVRGECYYYTDKYKESRDDFEIVVNHEYKSTFAWSIKGKCHVMLGEYDKAVRSYETACSWGSIANYHFYDLAGAYIRLDNWEKAKESIEKYLEESDDNYLGHILAGDIYRHSGEIETAINFYEKAYKLNEDDYTAYFALAYSYMIYEDYDKAVNNFLEITGDAYDDENIALDAVWACIMDEDGGTGIGCIETYNNLIKRKKIKKNKFIELYTGIVLYNAGEYEDAAKHFELAIEEDMCGESYIYLSMMHFESGFPEDAIEYAKKAIEAEPNNIVYQKRYEQIEKSQNKKGFLGLFKRKNNNIKWFMSEIQPYHKLGSLPDINVIIGDEDE